MKKRLCLQLTDTLEMHGIPLRGSEFSIRLGWKSVPLKISATAVTCRLLHSDLACHQCTETSMGTLYCSSISLANAILFLEAPRHLETVNL